MPQHAAACRSMPQRAKIVLGTVGAWLPRKRSGDPHLESTLALGTRRAEFSDALVWPLQLGLRTPTLRCGHLSGPSRTRGGFFDFEVGGHDGAYKGRVHVIVPFVGRKNGKLFDCQQSYTVLVLRVPRLEEGVMFGGKAL